MNGLLMQPFLYNRNVEKPLMSKSQKFAYVVREGEVAFLDGALRYGGYRHIVTKPYDRFPAWAVGADEENEEADDDSVVDMAAVKASGKALPPVTADDSDIPDSDDVVTLSPQKRAAQTRAARKASKDAEASKPVASGGGEEPPSFVDADVATTPVQAL